VGVLGGKICFEVSKTFEPSNDGAIVSSFHVGKKDKNKLIYKAPNDKVQFGKCAVRFSLWNGYQSVEDSS